MAATALLAWAMLTVPMPSQAAPESEMWGYLYAQCMQEKAQEPRHIGETADGDEPWLAIIVSNVVRLDGKSFEPYARFASELKRPHDLEMEPSEVGPFATWQDAAAALHAGTRTLPAAFDGKW